MEKYDDKLGEAAHFLERMREDRKATNLRALTYDLRAFLSAARSIASSAYKDAQKNGQKASQQYEALATREPVLKFFREVRNVNIHEAPVHPIQKIEPLRMHAVVRMPDGRRSPPSNVVTVNVVTYLLDNWPGPGNGEVIAACELYMKALRRLVDDATSDGIIVCSDT